MTDVLIDRISPQFWSILILESVSFIYATKKIFVKCISSSVCFHGPDKYFVKFYICISSCVRVLNSLDMFTVFIIMFVIRVSLFLNEIIKCDL